jgi:ParB family chromosome partitioning protein
VVLDDEYSGPYERGFHFKRALDAKVCGSARQLAEALSVDYSLVCKLLKLAELPMDVVRAFRSPTQIQVNWGAPLWRHQATWC